HVSLFEWCLQRFKKQYPSVVLFVLCTKGAREAPELQRIATQYSVDVLTTEQTLKLGAYNDVARQLCAKHLAIFTISFAFAPQDLLIRSCRHHMQCKNDYTS